MKIPQALNIQSAIVRDMLASFLDKCTGQLVEHQNTTDVKMKTSIIVSHTDELNFVMIFSTLEIDFGQGTTHFIVLYKYGIDGSVTGVMITGNKGIKPTKTSAAPLTKLMAATLPVSIVISDKGGRNTTVMFISIIESRKYSIAKPRLSYSVLPSFKVRFSIRHKWLNSEG
jgi:hypothetical protein